MSATMAIQSAPLWIKQRTIYFYKATETSSSTVTEAGNQAHPVLRRHASNGQVTHSCHRTFSNSSTTAEVSGVHHQFGAFPTQQIEFLGFNINSHSMLLSLPTQKLTSLENSLKHIMALKEVTVKELFQILGAMVAAHPAILPAPALQTTRKSQVIHSTTDYQPVGLSKRTCHGG